MDQAAQPRPPGESDGTVPTAPRVPRPRRLPERHSLRDQVLRALRSALLNGDLKPGALYSAPALAARFEVSATPVREAMHQLSREGAVEVEHNRGFRIAQRTARDLAELAEIRAMVELPVLLRLARTLPAPRWAPLRSLADAGAEAAVRGDRVAYASADRAFHGAMLALSGNAQLVLVAEELHRRAQWPPVAPGAVGELRGDRLAADAGEHVALLEALVAGEVAAAVALLERHFAAQPATRQDCGELTA